MKPSPLPVTPEAALAEIGRRDRGRLLASLIRSLGDFELAEDCLQEATISALEHWGRNGVPRAPAAWLLQVARRKAIDRIRRERNFHEKSAELAHLIAMEHEHPDPVEETFIPDERLSLIFTCCHPAIDPPSRVALTLHTLGGLTTGEIARAFLTTKETMAQRLVRAKRKIARAGIAYEVPGPALIDERLSSVLAVVYLIFNEGYHAASGDTAIRKSLCDEAIRLARLLDHLKPQEPEVIGLLALMLLHHSRRDARTRPDGNGEEMIVTLEDQDRSLWYRDLIREGCGLVEAALGHSRPGPYQLQAAISAVHCEAATHAGTDWHQIALLYTELQKVAPGPVVELNRAVAVSYWKTPEDAISIACTLEDELRTYRPFQAALADFHRRSGNMEAALDHYDRAIRMDGSASETRFLKARRQSLLH